MVYNAGVKRQIAMSFGFEFTRNPEAISDLIRDEQIKVTGCRFAQSPFTPLLNDFPLRCVCESIIVVTPALINLERSGRLINVWQLPRSYCYSFNLRVELHVIHHHPQATLKEAFVSQIQDYQL